MKNIFLSIVFPIFFSLISACDREASTTEEAATGAPASRLALLLGAEDDSDFPRVTRPRAFVFPEDHGPHRRYRNEWWYVTGNLDATSGERFGFELTLFRFALSPRPPISDSAWRSSQLYIGHFALTDVAAGEFLVAERFSRSTLGVAGAATEPMRVWLEDWTLAADGRDFRLKARAPEMHIDLRLSPAKPPVLNGEAGLSQKSSEPGNASYYYSMTRLRTTGRVHVRDRAFEVRGASWLDREWGSSALAADQVGWDWFALQLEDETELMFYQLRGRDGEADAMSAGTYVAADGSSQTLGYDDVTLEVLASWRSPAGGAYPARWRLTVPTLELELEVVPVMAAQELTTSVRYWEGAVDVDGRRAGRNVAGRGYVELTGYARDVLNDAAD